MNTLKIAMIVILTALCIGTNYALLPFFNVKFMDFIVFVGGFCFGPLVGGLVGVFSWGIYGSINPLGFSLPVWVSTMVGEAFFGVFGGLVKLFVFRKNSRIVNDKLGAAVLFAVSGLFLTLAYDLFTNLAYAYTYGINFIVAIIVGFVPFGIMHLLSNVVFFGVGCVPAINIIFKVTGGEKTVSREK
jgi:LytS/YehU family sensor histidine kinase